HPPCPQVPVPRPFHPGQVCSLAPFAAPLPPHSEQVSLTGSVTGTFPPRAATRKGISTTVSSVSVIGSSRRLRPKIEEKMSPRPPRPPRSLISNSSTLGPAPPGAPLLRPAPPGARGSNAPYRRIASYCLRFSASERTVCASDTSLKRSAADGLLGFASG